MAEVPQHLIDLSKHLAEKRPPGVPDEIWFVAKCPDCQTIMIGFQSIKHNEYCDVKQIESNRKDFLNQMFENGYDVLMNCTNCYHSFKIKSRKLIFCTEIEDQNVDKHYLIDNQTLNALKYQRSGFPEFDLRWLDFETEQTNEGPTIPAEYSAFRGIPHYIVFDTETTGRPNNYDAPVTDSRNWPRIVQLCWIEYDINGQNLNERSYIIKPEGYEIPSTATAIHRITTADALNRGMSLNFVLREFMSRIENAKVLIGHNLSFDISIVAAELYRKQYPNPMHSKKQICTMKSSVDFCALKNAYGNKYPSLQELHQRLFASSFQHAHNATQDVNASAKCFWELVNRGVLTL